MSQRGPAADGPVGPPERVLAMLADADLWQPPPDREEAVITQIRAAGTTGWGAGGRLRAGLAGAAAVLAALAVLVLTGLLDLDPPGGLPAGTPMALAATAEAPVEAEAVMRLQELADGMRIELDVSGLPPAPADGYYEAMLRIPGQDPVSAGSFHLRGGGERVVLWAGVDLEPTLVATIVEQPRGTVLLAGQLDRPTSD